VYLRDLLATRVVEEPEVTAFLACWAYEELWHGEALSRFLGEAGARVEPSWERARWDDPYPSRVARTGRNRAGARRGRRRLGRRAMALGSALFRAFPGVHMAWGAINELSTATAYERLIERTQHPVLADVLARLIRDERRHYSFYRVEAERRLGGDHLARRLARLALARSWAIVGTGVRPRSETDFVVLHLFGGDDGLRAARGMDATVDGLPGLAGLHLFERERARSLRRAGAGSPANRRAVRGESCSTGS
jgi:rubrerythrin